MTSGYGLWRSKEEGWFCWYVTAYNNKKPHKVYRTNKGYYHPTKYKNNTRLSGDCLGRWLDDIT